MAWRPRPRLTIRYLPSDAPAAEAVDIPGVEVAEILAALGTVVQIGFQAIITLTQPVYLIIVGMQGLDDIMGIVQMAENLLFAHFPGSIPAGSLPAMCTGRAVSPHNSFLEL